MMALPKDAFAFLTELKRNNNREWFHDQKPRFKLLNEAMLDFIDELIDALIPYDPLLAGVHPRDCLFRLHKDARFSKGQAPYKTHFGIHLVNTGKRSDFNRAGFYLCIEPNGCLMAGGAHAPSAPWLLNIRRDIEAGGSEFQAILDNPTFQQWFDGLRGAKLIRPPRGFSADLAQIELIKHRAFWVQHEFADEIATGNTLIEYYTQAFQVYQPLQLFLNQAARAALD
jgi:uncharacterized protein (TIGR02453 family)